MVNVEAERSLSGRRRGVASALYLPCATRPWGQAMWLERSCPPIHGLRGTRPMASSREIHGMSREWEAFRRNTHFREPGVLGRCGTATRNLQRLATIDPVRCCQAAASERAADLCTFCCSSTKWSPGGCCAACRLRSPRRAASTTRCQVLPKFAGASWQEHAQRDRDAARGASHVETPRVRGVLWEDDQYGQRRTH